MAQMGPGQRLQIPGMAEILKVTGYGGISNRPYPWSFVKGKFNPITLLR